MALPVVDLPQPDSPTSPSVSPRATSKLIPLTALMVLVPPGVELDHEVVDLQEHVLGRTQVCGSGSSHQTDSSSVARSLPIAASAGGYSLAMLVSNAAWPSGVPTGK